MPIAIRPATMDDFAFIDSLQGKHTKQVGWMPRAQLEGKIKLGHVLVAESDETASAASPRDASPLTPPFGTTLSRRERGPERASTPACRWRRATNRRSHEATNGPDRILAPSPAGRGWSPQATG